MILTGLLILVAGKCTKAACRIAIDEAWDKYDANVNGVLEKNEVRKMIMDLLETFGQEDSFDEDTFSDAFDFVDHDDDNDIEKKQVQEFSTDMLAVMMMAEE